MKTKPCLWRHDLPRMHDVFLAKKYEDTFVCQKCEHEFTLSSGGMGDGPYWTRVIQDYERRDSLDRIRPYMKANP